MPAFWDQSQMVQWWALSPQSKMTHKFHSPPTPPPLTVAHPYSGCHWLGYCAHKKQCLFRVLLNSANLAAYWHIWQIWAFQSSSLPSRGVLGLNYLTFGTALQNWGERKGGRGLCRDTSAAVEDRSWGGMVKRTLPACEDDKSSGWEGRRSLRMSRRKRKS